MPNTIVLAQKFIPVIDGIYKKASLTSILDAQTLDFGGVNTVKVMKVSTTGLGDYSKENGYPQGNATLEWEDMTLNEDRSAALTVDRMDNEETLGQAFGVIMNEFIRTNVAPEVDAYRFAKYAKTADIGTAAAALADGEAVVKALRAAITAMDEAEVPTEDRVLFITPTLKGLIDDLDTTKSKEVLKRFSAIIEVPQTRFYTDITLNSGADAWGFTKGEGAKDINFVAVAKSAVVQATKMALPKVFDPDTNQSKDAWLFQYRLYHDCFAYDNKVKGIYVHTKA
jgi:hypothetical protein